MCLLISSFASQLLLFEIGFTLSLLLLGCFCFCLLVLLFFVFFLYYYFFNRHFERVLIIETTCFLEEIFLTDRQTAPSQAFAMTQVPLLLQETL